ncbi:MAG TPA: carbohydrate ABC transporter permease [Aggregatilineales bacterium]|nr:carbohydrate ABC transporter permease [Aggregatilineales bacterium]
MNGLKSIGRVLGSDRTFNVFSFIMLTFTLIIVAYPLYFMVIASVSSPDAIYSGQVWLYPKDVTFEGYERIFADNSILTGYRNSAIYTALGTFISVSLILTAGYALSRKDLVGRNVFMFFFVLTMFFDGGIIPRYLLVRDLGMFNTVWAMVLPNAVGVWNLIIARTFFQITIPDELREAAFIDGASNIQFFLRVVLPLSTPIIAVMVLIHAVGNWNSFFDALIFITREDMYPLQLVLRNILTQSDVTANAAMLSGVTSYADQQRVTELIKYGMIIVASIPLIILYPFLQRYFVKGMMIGAIKG